MEQIEQLLETMLERQERMSSKLAELLAKIDELNRALAGVKDLIKEYPNDTELGNHIRKTFKN